MVKCLKCSEEYGSYRSLSAHIKREHNQTSELYIIEHFGKGCCKECNNYTNFKNLNIGFREFCSNKCVNVFKSKDEDFLKKISIAQKGKPRKKHTDKTKKLLSDISKQLWIDKRDYIMEKMNTPERLEKLSKAGVNSYKYKNVGYYKNIRYESKDEKIFIEKCIKGNIRIKRFEDDLGNLSIKIDSHKWCIPDFKLDNIIIDVKDFHHWFKEELFTGLKKYKLIDKWCKENGFIFMFWFKDYGYQFLDKIIKIKTESDISIFKNDNKNPF